MKYLHIKYKVRKINAYAFILFSVLCCSATMLDVFVAFFKYFQISCWWLHFSLIKLFIMLYVCMYDVLNTEALILFNKCSVDFSTKYAFCSWICCFQSLDLLSYLKLLICIISWSVNATATSSSMCIHSSMSPVLNLNKMSQADNFSFLSFLHFRCSQTSKSPKFQKVYEFLKSLDSKMVWNSDIWVSVRLSACLCFLFFFLYCCKAMQRIQTETSIHWHLLIITYVYVC